MAAVVVGSALAKLRIKRMKKGRLRAKASRGRKLQGRNLVFILILLRASSL